MQVSVEKISNVERRLTIIVPSDQVEEAYTKQINQFAKKAKIKGFRPGKVPISYVQQYYGEDMRREALSEVMQKAFYNAIQEKQLKPINTPRIEPKKITANQPLEFTADFEVLPEIENIQLNIDKIEKLETEINDQDVSSVIDQLRKQQTNWREIDEIAKESNRVVIDYYAIFEGKSDIENTIKDFPLELGSKVMIPGFEEGLLGTKLGDEKTLSLTFPADFNVPEKAGKAVDFIVQIKKVFAADIPTLDENFIKKIGVSSGKEEDLRQQVKNSLEQERNRLVKEKLKEQVFSQLLEQNKVELPQSLIEREAKNIHDEVYQHQDHDHQHHSDAEMARFNEIAKKRVALGILIAEYAKRENLKPDHTLVLQRIQEIASVYENPQEVVKWLTTDERHKAVEAQVLEDQVLDKLVEGKPVTIKTMTYAELKGIRI